MFNNDVILPEACCKFVDLSFKNTEIAYITDQTVVGLVEEIIHEKQEIIVRLGENLVATLPYEESTIYSFTYSKNNPDFVLPLQIASLKGKLICAKIKKMTDDKIILSRKDNMLEAYDIIKNRSKLPFYVTSARTCFVFGDIGQGIHAKLGLSDLAKARIHSTSEVCKKGDTFFVKLINFDELKRANVSYKEAFPDYNPDDYSIGDIVIGHVNDPVDSNFTGVFINVSPQVVGIMDYQPWHPFLNYGDLVECIVNRASDKGLHLRLSKVLKHSR